MLCGIKGFVQEAHTYFWNKVPEKNLEAAMGGVRQAKGLFIAVAFCSLTGSEFLVNQVKELKLQKDAVEIVLGKMFTNRDYANILSQLTQTGKVYIKKESQFHAKVFMYEQEDDQTVLIFGSGNLTGGGLLNNLEFGCKCIEKTSSNELRGFKYAAKHDCVEVTDSLIEKLSAFESRIAANATSTNGLENLLNEVLGLHKGDPFQPSDYSFRNHLFEYVDYETFFPRYAASADSRINERRITVQQKLLSILTKRY